MCIPSKILWCFVLLLVAMYSASHGNSTKILTNGNIKKSYNSMFQRPLDLYIVDRQLQNPNDKNNSTRCNLHKNCIINKMPYELYINFTKNERKNDNSEQYESRRHIIKEYDERNRRSLADGIGGIGGKYALDISNNTLSLQIEHNKSSVKNVVKTFTELPTESVTEVIPIKIDTNLRINADNCIRFCCPPQHFMSISGKCIDGATYNEPILYKINDSNSTELCRFTNDPCSTRGLERRLTSVSIIDGLLHQDKLYPLPLSEFCLATMYSNMLHNDSIYHMIVCTNDDESKYPIYLSMCLLVSLPFLLLTFIVYTVLPELQNVHGYTLRAHVVSLFVTNVFLFCGTKICRLRKVNDTLCCIITAYVYYFFFLSSFFWLNVICFDIWLTFKKIRLCRLNMKQAKKKFVIYSSYAWGVPLIFIIFCAIIDNVDGIPKNWKPEICVDRFWFSTVEAKTIYFYVPMFATVISNSCFFIATTVSIIHQNIHTANHLETSDNKSYNKNKHRIKMFVKLFVMMIYGGIIWIIEVIAWKNTDYLFVWYPTDMLNSLQGVIIFVIFVYKNKTKQLLLKRFGGQPCGPFCMVPPYNHTTTSNITSTLTMESSREIDSFNQQSRV